MRLLSPASAVSISRAVGLAGLGCAAVLTMLDRGATRAYASPWITLLWIAQLAPIAALVLRSLGPARPLNLPSRGWVALSGAFAAAVLLSAWFSPYRAPSLLAALMPLAGIAGFLLVFDWLEDEPEAHAERLLKLAGFFAGALVLTSLLWWVADHWAATPPRPLARWLDHRNEHPLGHSNYTAGLALLALPWLGTLAWRTRGITRLGWGAVTLLGIAMLISSGSRGGLVALAILLGLAVVQARLGWKRLTFWALAGVALILTLAFAQPRVRVMLLNPRLAAEKLGASTEQRSAMLAAGSQMGADRPVLGWGPGTTPLAYPRYRAGLDGGVENALQLHSTPAQLWADLGGAGALAALALLALVARDGFRRSPRLEYLRPLRPSARTLLATYGVYSLFDYQLDLPIVTLSLALAAAALARRAEPPVGRNATRAVGAAAAGALALVGVFGERDPAPVMNTRALLLAEDKARVPEAIALLRESLALNPDQEIAHFNLGWLLLVEEPAAAERHFLAAAWLVPDKGGVYFGLALARMNQGDRDPLAIAQPLGLECLNDPLFLTSPWWRLPAVAGRRNDALAALRALGADAMASLAAAGDPRSREVGYVLALADWLEGNGSLAGVLAQAHTAERVRYFASRPVVPNWSDAGVRAYRRERTGYPILMRNLDLPPPVDRFDVQENVVAADELSFLFPPKGWLPEPLLLRLLREPLADNL